MEISDPFGPGHEEPDVIELSSQYVNEVVTPDDSVQNAQKHGNKALQPSPIKLEKLSVIPEGGFVQPKQRRVDAANDLYLQL